MPDEDATLSEFVDGADEDTASDQAGEEDPMATSTWTPGGEPCERCGEKVERRWRDGAETVCDDCKDW